MSVEDPIQHNNEPVTNEPKNNEAVNKEVGEI